MGHGGQVIDSNSLQFFMSVHSKTFIQLFCANKNPKPSKSPEIYQKRYIVKWTHFWLHNEGQICYPGCAWSVSI